MLRATQLLPHTRYSDSEHRSFVQLGSFGESVAAFAVTGGATLELTLAQYWSSLGGAELEAELAFHGVDARPLAIDGAAGNAKLLVRAPLRREKVKPSAKLDVLRIPLRPTEAELAPLSAPRDALPGGRTIHRLVLTYKLSLAEDGKVRPTLPMLNRYVYDGEMEAQMYMVTDGNRRLLSTGDIYPEEVKLKKGDYTLRLLLRHDDAATLDALRALPLVVERRLESAVAVPAYDTNGDSVRGGPAAKDRTLCPG